MLQSGSWSKCWDTRMASGRKSDRADRHKCGSVIEDPETGSGGNKAGNNGREVSCAGNGKWITSLAAIVAPPVRLWLGARSVLITPARPASYEFCCLVFLPFLFFFPCPQYVTCLYSSTLAKSVSVQYRSRAPATSSAIGFGTTLSSIHL